MGMSGSASFHNERKSWYANKGFPQADHTRRDRIAIPLFRESWDPWDNKSRSRLASGLRRQARIGQQLLEFGVPAQAVEGAVSVGLQELLFMAPVGLAQIV